MSLISLQDEKILLVYTQNFRTLCNSSIYSISSHIYLLYLTLTLTLRNNLYKNLSHL